MQQRLAEAWAHRLAMLCAPLVLALASCGSTPKASGPAGSTVADVDFDARLKACQTAAEALGFEVLDSNAPTPADFHGLLLEPGFLELATRDVVVLHGDAEALAHNPYLCGFSRLPSNCADIPHIAVSDQGTWALLQQPLPPGVAAPPAEPTCSVG